LKSYLEVEIPFNQTNYDRIYETLYLHGITTIFEENGIVKFFIEEKNKLILEEIKSSLIKHCLINSSDTHVSKFEDKDWNKEWEKTIEPIYIKDKIVIYPSWKEREILSSPVEIKIQIDPKMSFGTGHNETTQLILELMCENIDSSKDKTMLDFGCGTGILAIAGIKLGLEQAIGIDTDKDAIENAKECIENNGLSDRIRLLTCDLLQVIESGFDIVTTNIVSSVIIPNLKLIHTKLNPNGKLFLSGILIEEKDLMIQQLTKNNFELKDYIQRAEWSAFYCKKE